MASLKLKDRMHEKQSRYIYHLPYSITRQISQNLDIDNSWQQLAAEIGYTHQQVRVFEMASRTPGQSPTQQLLADWQAKNPTAQDLHDKLHKINRRREMQILEAWFTSESDDSKSFSSSKRNNSNDDRTPSQIQAALDNFDSNSFKPPGKLSRKPTPPKMEDVNLNRCDTFKEKREMGSKHMDGGLISNKPFMKKQMSKETERDDKTLMHEMGITGAGKSLDNMAHVNNKRLADMAPMCNGSKDTDADYSIALNGIHNFTYKEITQATNGFSDEFLIGQGAFGKVFRAVLKNTKCAVKKLFSREEVSRGDASNPTEEHIKRELATLSRYRHNNIVLLYGYMIDQPDVCLVYQLMPNGSLEDRLACKNDTPALTWKQRLRILRGAACGLQFLHTLTDIPLIHGDIKSGNILLDSSFEAKISDLGMAQHATSGESGLLTHITKKQADTKQYQTRAYHPPEFQRGCKMSIKGDTYSFGVVIFEVCTGEKSFDEKREGADAKFLVDYIQEKVGDVEEKFFTMCDYREKNIPEDLFTSVFKLAKNCTCPTKKGRPEMKMVFTDLEKLEEDFQNIFNGACESVHHLDQSSIPYYVDSQGRYISYYPGSINPHLASMLAQFRPGTQLPESLVLQLGYDQNTVLITPGQCEDPELDLKAQQKLAEIKKYENEFNKTKEMVVNEGVSEIEESNEGAGVSDDVGSKNLNSYVEKVQYQTESMVETASLRNCDDSQPECEGETHTEMEPMDQAQRQLEIKKLQPEDPTVKEKFAKSRDDFFARFQQQIMLETSYSDECDNVCENDDEDEDENTIINNADEQTENYQNMYQSDEHEEHYDSNQLFSPVDENEDLSCENDATEEDCDYGEKLDVHRQKFDNYQIIAREMSDECGEVVGELVENNQRPFEGDNSENEDSSCNNFGRNSFIETDGNENVSDFTTDNMNVLQHQVPQQSNFPWQLQRRPEATESECYV